MSDDFDEFVAGWMRDRGAVDGPAVDELAASVAALPPRPRRARLAPLAAAAAVVAIGLVLILAVPRSNHPAAVPPGPVPPDPAAFAGDPRLAACGATVETALDAFEMTHARDYQRYLPAMLLAPELDTDAPAFVVVYRDMLSFPGGAPPPVGQTFAPAVRSLAPGHYDMCVLVEGDRSTAQSITYADVDITGLNATVDEPVASGPASPETPPSSSPSNGTGTTLTPEPGPAWAGDATAALACADPSRAGLVPLRDASFAATDPDDDRLLRFYLDSVRTAGDPFPIDGWILRDATASAHLYVALTIPVATFQGHVDIGGPAKAALVVSSRPPVAPIGSTMEWVVSAVAACDPSEFDPTTPTGSDLIGIWTDASGARVPSGTLLGTADCYEGTQVRFRDRLYVRIPGGGVDPSQLETSWATDVPIPSSARVTTYRSGDLRLYTAADGRAIYFGANGRGERLPHVIGDEVVRVDCN
jgi:hypothetical protein